MKRHTDLTNLMIRDLLRTSILRVPAKKGGIPSTVLAFFIEPALVRFAVASCAIYRQLRAVLLVYAWFITRLVHDSRSMASTAKFAHLSLNQLRQIAEAEKISFKRNETRAELEQKLASVPLNRLPPAVIGAGSPLDVATSYRRPLPSGSPAPPKVSTSASAAAAARISIRPIDLPSTLAASTPRRYPDLKSPIDAGHAAHRTGDARPSSPFSMHYSDAGTPRGAEAVRPKSLEWQWKVPSNISIQSVGTSILAVLVAVAGKRIARWRCVQIRAILTVRMMQLFMLCPTLLAWAFETRKVS